MEGVEKYIESYYVPSRTGHLSTVLITAIDGIGQAGAWAACASDVVCLACSVF